MILCGGHSIHHFNVLRCALPCRELRRKTSPLVVECSYGVGSCRQMIFPHRVLTSPCGIKRGEECPRATLFEQDHQMSSHFLLSQEVDPAARDMYVYILTSLTRASLLD